MINLSLDCMTSKLQILHDPKVPTPTGIQRGGRENVGSTSDDDNTASSKTMVQNLSSNPDKSKCASASTRFAHSIFLLIYTLAIVISIST